MSKNHLVLRINDLTTGYGSRVVSSHIHASLQPGELVSLLGSNGVGKSTLLRTLSVSLPPIDGDVYLDEKPLSCLTDAERSRMISIVLTERVDSRSMTVQELVGMGRSPYTGFWGGMDKDDLRLVQEAMNQVGISSLGHRYVHTLSDGERQKVMIAKSLAQQTPVILLDEPTAFLDFPSKVEVMRLLRNLAQEMHKIIFLSTHDVDIALQLSHRIWLMTSQEIITGTTKELTENGTLSRFIQSPGISFDEGRQMFLVHS